ncbi:MAG TPA: hypothetical protein VIS49_05495 [Cyclobacteriaceae bacterium]
MWYNYQGQVRGISSSKVFLFPEISMKIKAVIVISILVLAGCGSLKLTAEGMKVKLMRQDPPIECQQLVDLYVEEDDLAEAKTSLRNEAALKGSNYVRLDALEYFRGDAVASGSAFKCNSLGSVSGPS